MTLPGKAQQEFNHNDQQSDIPINSKDTANIIYDYFITLTSNYPEVHVIASFHKTFARCFAAPLSYIFNESFTHRTSPDIWKIS